MENQNPNSTAVRKPPPKMDRLSSLPDVILEEILSLLPTSAAAATSVLSRRWGQLWTRVTHLHFESYDVDFRTFLTSVDSALSRVDSFSNIRYFYLQFNLTDIELRKGEDQDEYDFCYSFLNRWLIRLCGLHSQRIDVGEGDDDFVRICVQNSVVVKTINSVIDDDVRLESSNCRAICLPQCVFQSETLTELLLNSWFRFKLPEFVNLPNLKKLSLRVFDSYRDFMQTLFKSLPSLEDLTLLSAALRRKDHCIEISAHSLKKICLRFGGQLYKAQILIDAPKLEHISIKSVKSLFIRFVSIPSALSSAQLILDARRFLGDDPVNQTMELLKGISCVKSLTIFCPAVGILNRVNLDALPSFQNLTHLDLLLARRNYNFDIPLWLLRKVKTIDVKGRGNYFEMSAVETILSRADALERFCVSFSDVDGKQIDLQQKEETFVRALFMLPRVSTRCEIQFKGMVVSASTNDS